MQLQEIKASHMLVWQNSIDKAPKTIINYRSTLNTIFKYAVYDEIINTNPLSMIKAPKIAKKEIKVFTAKEIGLLITHTSGQLKNIILFTAFTGIRAGELIALKWSDIDFRSKTITIARRTREGDEDVPKSKRVRILDMLPQAKKALVEQMPLSKNKSEYIFLSRFDIPYKRSNKISASIRRMCKKLKIEEGTLQTLRRSCNTLYKQYGLPNDWILDQLGHIEEGVNRTHYTGRIKPNLSEIGRLLAE
jgi:integrase